MDKEYSININFDSKDWNIIRTADEVNQLFRKLSKLDCNISSINQGSISIGNYVRNIKSQKITPDILNSLFSELLQVPQIYNLSLFREFIEYSKCFIM